jgi:hypothetical protein
MPSTEADEVSIAIIRLARIFPAKRKKGEQKVASAEADPD